MTLKEATDIMQKTRQCGGAAMDCLEKEKWNRFAVSLKKD